MSEALARWREFCRLAEERFGPGWRDVVIPGPFESFRLGDQWGEFGLLEDPDNPRPVSYGVWQINPRWSTSTR